MRRAGYRFALLLAAVLVSACALLTASFASAQLKAKTATVTGEKIQKVGFPAMIQKKAIMYNFAGPARNNPGGSGCGNRSTNPRLRHSADHRYTLAQVLRKTK